MRNKLSTLLAVLISIGAAHVARAADMAMKAPPPPQPASYNWAGWYAGGNIGYGWGVPSDPGVSFVDPGPTIGFGAYFAGGGNVTPNLKPSGVIGGGQIGYNWMLTPNWVGGLVADFQGSAMKSSASNTVTVGPTTTNQANSENIDWFGTVRAKLGVAQNNWLLYATGGLAYGRISTSGNFVIPPGTAVNFNGSNATTNAGWTAGVGLNYGLTSNWILGVEYLYVDLGHVSHTELQPAFPAVSLTVNNHAAANIVRASLDYKF